MGSVIKSISTSIDFHNLAKKHQISWSEAARVGMSMLLADEGVIEYDNNLNLMRRQERLRLKLEEVSNKYQQLLEKNAE